MSLLDVTKLSVRYGGVHALSNVELHVDNGSLVGLIGPNGAGKTTFVDAVTGFAGSTGSIEFDGRAIESLPAHARAQLGMARTWQAAELFDDLSVEENLEVAAEAARPWWTFLADCVRPTRRHTSDGVADALKLLELDGLAGRKPRGLSYGQRKIVGIARAIVTRPRLVLLDEPAAGLDEIESAALGVLLRQIVSQELSMVLIDHDVSLVSTVCEQLYVFDRGTTLASGATAAVLADPAVVQAYLGAAATDPKTGGDTS